MTREARVRGRQLVCPSKQYLLDYRNKIAYKVSYSFAMRMYPFLIQLDVDSGRSPTFGMDCEKSPC